MALTDYQQRKLRKKKQMLADMKAGLPHLYGQKLYRWQKDFINARQEMGFLTAANQIGKSTCMIILCITWATKQSLWPQLWPKMPKPKLFWYLYPSKEVATMEWRTKWEPLMPQGAYKDHPQYGWEVKFSGENIDYIKFNSGVFVVFKTYGQRTMVLQTASVWAVFSDEELPEQHYSELAFRIEGTQGYFRMVFTATLGQQMWMRTMEGKGEAELFPDAFKRQVSMYDCQVYADGTPGPYNEARIQKAIGRCKNRAEIDRRVHGKFVKDEGRVYVQYDPTRHVVKPFKIPSEWARYGAADPGSGGTNHKPAVAFIAVNPKRTKGVVYKGWKGDDGRDYTAEDCLQKFVEVRGDDQLTLQLYDQNARDFFTIGTRMGENFLKSEKHHDVGEGAVNTLFKNDMLHIFDDSGDDSPQLHKLGSEMMTIPSERPKNQRDDDFSDCVRYICATIPWDYESLSGRKQEEDRKRLAAAKRRLKPETEQEAIARRIKERRRGFVDEGSERSGWGELTDEIDEYNSLYEGGPS